VAEARALGFAAALHRQRQARQTWQVGRSNLDSFRSELDSRLEDGMPVGDLYSARNYEGRLDRQVHLLKDALAARTVETQAERRRLLAARRDEKVLHNLARHFATESRRLRLKDEQKTTDEVATNQHYRRKGGDTI